MQAEASARQSPIAQALRSIRHALGLTQEWWAALLGVRTATLQGWEAGTVAPRRQVLLHIRELLSQSLESRLRIARDADAEGLACAIGLVDPLPAIAYRRLAADPPVSSATRDEASAA
jgi:DNA-binding XRE family transcriptional regulator